MLLPFLALPSFDVPVIQVEPTFVTQAVSDDADDPAIWVNPADASKSVIFGTNKEKAPTGGIYAFDLDGKIRQEIHGLDRPNNCDVEYGLKAGARSIDILVVTERLKRRLLVFEIGADGTLHDITGKTDVFAGEPGESGAPMGVACYRRPSDGAVYAIVSPKEGAKQNHLAQYELAFDAASGKVDATLVRRFGDYSGVKETESVAVDDATGIVYYSDETVGTHKYLADPNQQGADTELAFFNREGTKGDHEGIAMWGRYVVCTDQLKGGSDYRVFDGDALVAVLHGPADETDGIEIVDRPLGPKFPKGILVAMNSSDRNFMVFDLSKIRLP